MRSEAQLERAAAPARKAGLPLITLDDRSGGVSGSVAIGTMHLAKGLEFRAVAVAACDHEILPLQSRIESVADDADLDDLVATGQFREDLLHRLRDVELGLPPLRQRKEDLALLVQSFLADFNQRNNKKVSALDQAAMRILEQYNWPGNIRELRNVIERAVILSSGEFIDPKLLPPLVTESPDVVKPTLSLTPGTTVEEAETRLILMTLEHTRDNKTRAAEILGISLKTLHNKLNKLRGRGKRTEEESVPQ